MKLEGQPGQILMRGTIGDFDGCISADDFMDLLAEQDGSDLTIHLDSEGGCVRSGISIHNQIAQYSGQVTVHIDAMCASIATVIACGADRVIMNHNAQFMIHNAWTFALGDAKEFRQMADILDMLDGTIAETYAEKGEPSAQEFKEMMDRETYLTAAQAQDLGLVDEVFKPESKRPAAKSEPKMVSQACAAQKSGLIAAKARTSLMRMRLSRGK